MLIVRGCVSGRHHSILYIGHMPMKTKFSANIGCVVSLKLHVRRMLPESVFHYRMPTIQVGRHLTITC
jgi:hypothetical protein